MGGNHSVIPRGYQALIPSYRFDCSGNITEWLVGVTSPTVELIEIELQVWRPTVNHDNGPPCFSRVGSNIFTVSSTVQVANFTPTEQIEFQSGDVVGFRLLSPSQEPTASPTVTEHSNNRGDKNPDEDRRENEDSNFKQGRDNEEDEDEGDDEDDDDDDDDDGVVILNEINNITPNEEVWFSPVDNTVLGRDVNSNGCALSIGSNGMLSTFTNAAPLISASVLVIDENLQVQVIRPSMPELSPITAKDERHVLILVSATSAPAILIVLVSIIIAVICTYCLVRRRRNKVLNHNHSMPALNHEDAAGQRTVVATVYRRAITQNTTLNVEPGAVRIALIPHTTARHNNRAQQANRSAEITREDQSIARASEINNIMALNGSKNKPIIMRRNESYGKLETIADSTSDAEYYFMYDYPNVY